MPENILKSVSTIASMTLLSRISGLIRDVMFANILGDKAAADIFFVAFRIPNFFRRIFGEGAFAAAFIPVFTEYREHHSESETNGFVQLMIGRLGVILMATVALCFVFAPYLVATLATGFLDHPEKYALTVQSTRITLPYIFFISFVAMSAAMLNTCGRFAAPAATPILLNICLISAAVLLVPQMQYSPIALSIGVFIAGFVQLIFQLPFLRKQGLTMKPRLRARAQDKVASEGVSKVFGLMLPAILGVSVAQINVIVNTILASFLITGSISWLYYSDRLMEFPVGVFGIALATAFLPHLSKIHQQDKTDLFPKTLDWGARWVFLVCIPSTAALILLAEPMVSTIYFHGDFTENGVKMTAFSLIAYAIGMSAIVMVKVLAPGFYARQNTKTPVRVAMASLVLNMVFCLLLIMPFKHVGLALATSASSIFNAVVLFILLRKEGHFVLQPGWWTLFARLTIATLMMCLLLSWFRGERELWLTVSVWQRVLKLSGLVFVGGVVYLASLWILGLRIEKLKLPVHHTDSIS